MIGRLWARERADGDAGAHSPAAAMWIGAALANAPDLDLVTSLLSPTAYLDHHRGVTHSLVMLPLWALLCAGLLRKYSGRESFARYLLLAVPALLSHVLADSVGSYGTFVFAPLSDYRLRLDWLFIIDPWITGGLLLGLGALLAWRAHGRRLALWTLVLLAGYTAAAATRHHQALALWRARLAADGIAAGRIAAVPQAGSLNHWLLLAADNATTRAAPLTLSTPWALSGDSLAARYLNRFRPLDALEIHRFPTAPPPPPDAPLLDDYLAFARFPVAWSEGAACEPGAPRPLVHWRDLQYGWENDYNPFHLMARLDGAGRAVDFAMQSRRGPPHWISVAPLRLRLPGCLV